MSFGIGVVSSVSWILFFWFIGCMLLIQKYPVILKWPSLAWVGTLVLWAMWWAFGKLVDKLKFRAKDLTKTKPTRGKLAIFGLIALLWILEFFAIWRYWPAMMESKGSEITSLVALIVPLLIVVTFLEQLWGERVDFTQERPEPSPRNVGIFTRMIRKIRE